MTQNRKREHVEIVSQEDVGASYRYWDDIVLVHKALPEIDVTRSTLASRSSGGRSPLRSSYPP